MLTFIFNISCVIKSHTYHNSAMLFPIPNIIFSWRKPNAFKRFQKKSKRSRAKTSKQIAGVGRRRDGSVSLVKNRLLSSFMHHAITYSKWSGQATLYTQFVVFNCAAISGITTALAFHSLLWLTRGFGSVH